MDLSCYCTDSFELSPGPHEMSARPPRTRLTIRIGPRPAGDVSWAPGTDSRPVLLFSRIGNYYCYHQRQQQKQQQQATFCDKSSSKQQNILPWSVTTGSYIISINQHLCL